MPHPLNRPHKVDEATGEFLFSIYKLLCASNVEPRIKQPTFETAAESKNQWRVVSISTDALRHIHEFRNAVGLRRGHILSRFSRSQHLFQHPPLDKKTMLQYFFEHDTVALVTKLENNVNGVAHWSKLHAVPEGLFTSGSFSINVRNIELTWVDENYERISRL
jgi:hypothetical protein